MLPMSDFIQQCKLLCMPDNTDMHILLLLLLLDHLLAFLLRFFRMVWIEFLRQLLLFPLLGLIHSQLRQMHVSLVGSPFLCQKINALNNGGLPHHFTAFYEFLMVFYSDSVKWKQWTFSCFFKGALRHSPIMSKTKTMF